jgi:hypothetical protein
MLNRIIVNDIDITDYRNHPRILELRFVAIYDRWHREFGDRADGILVGLAEAFHCDITKLRVVANQAPAIRRVTKGQRVKNAQEHVFMGEVWREARYTSAGKYMNLSTRTLYAHKEYIPKNFLTQEWLNELDGEVVACGLKQYAVELERFLESHYALSKVI